MNIFANCSRGVSDEPLSNVPRFIRSVGALGLPLAIYLVGLSGLEPPTSRLSGARSNQLSYKPITVVLSFIFTHGGDDGIRTHDPLLAGQVLSQLSYTPV